MSKLDNSNVPRTNNKAGVNKIVLSASENQVRLISYASVDYFLPI